ncbi:MAG: DnaJ domain-containing protein [Cytophagales bacterium]|nr:DnaJ domain-containing protein [Bernardetiaceae bacterium]MDW8205880.1 DnaJ domain-containing protein [Cytophagales bacterium]
MVNLYEVLGLPNFASAAEIKSAFKRLAFQYHPDRNPNNPQAEEKFKAINHAYQYLSNPEKKAHYDYLLRLGYDPSRQPVRRYAPVRNPMQRRRAYVRKMSPEERAEHERYVKAAPWVAFGIVGYMFFIVYSLFAFIGRINYHWAYEAYQQGKYLEAEYYLNQGLGTDHNYFRALFLRGKIYIDHFGFYEEGRRLVQAAIDNAEIEFPEFYYYRGLANSYLGNPDSARMNFMYAFAKMPPQKALYMRAATLLLFKNQSLENAKIIFNTMIQKGMADEAVYSNLAIIAHLQEDYVSEVKAYSNAILCNPRNAEWYYKRAQAYINLAQIAESCYDWNIAKKLNKTIQDETLDYFCESYSAKTNN